MERRVVTFYVKDSLGDPYGVLNSLPKVELDVDAEDRLHDLVPRAFEAAGFAKPDTSSLLFLSRADDKGDRAPVPYLEVGVDASGVMFWRVGPGSEVTTIADVERAAAAGLFGGDPYAYSVDRGGYGDSGITTAWNELVDFLTTVGGVGGGIAVVAEGAKRLVRVINKHSGGWRARHARFPDTFLNTIVRRSEWDSAKLARLLDVPEGDVRDLLEALGYVESTDGLFRYSNDSDRAALRKRLAERHYLWDGWHEPRQPASDDPPPG